MAIIKLGVEDKDAPGKKHAFDAIGNVKIGEQQELNSEDTKEQEETEEEVSKIKK